MSRSIKRTSKPSFGTPTEAWRSAWDLLGQAGISGPPVALEPLAKELGLTIDYFSGAEHFAPHNPEDLAQGNDTTSSTPRLFDDAAYRVAASPGPRTRQMLGAPDGLLRRTSRYVWLNSDNPRPRQRMSFGHECGHDVLLGHEELNHLEAGCLADPLRSKAHEHEADEFAAHLLMPPPWFAVEAHDSRASLDWVSCLADRYETSLEATAIQFVHTSPYPCAVLLVEPHIYADDGGALTLRVRYAVRSHRFGHHIPPGTALTGSSLFQSVASSKVRQMDVVRGGTFGLRIDRRFLVECWPWGPQGDQIALIREQWEGRQGRFLSLGALSDPYASQR